MTTPLRLLRKRQNKTLKDVALALNATVSHLSRIENAQMKASPDLAERLAKYFGHEVSEIQILYPERFATNA